VTYPSLPKQFSQGGEDAGYTPTPNWFYDEVLKDKDVPDSVLRVFQYLFRSTVGRSQFSAELPLETIMHNAGVAREGAVYALKILCDCWQLWEKTQGRKGHGASRYTVLSSGCDDGETHITFRDTFRNQKELTVSIYGKSCPTREDLKQNPPTRALYDQEQERQYQRSMVELNLTKLDFADTGTEGQAFRTEFDSRTL
jgi:hypothetical protein